MNATLIQSGSNPMRSPTWTFKQTPEQLETRKTILFLTLSRERELGQYIHIYFPLFKHKEASWPFFLLWAADNDVFETCDITIPRCRIYIFLPFPTRRNSDVFFSRHSVLNINGIKSKQIKLSHLLQTVLYPFPVSAVIYHNALPEKWDHAAFGKQYHDR